MKKSIVKMALVAAIATVAGSATAVVHAATISIPVSIGSIGPSATAYGTSGRSASARGRRYSASASETWTTSVTPTATYSLSVRVACSGSNYYRSTQGTGVLRSVSEDCNGKGVWQSSSGTINVLN